MSETDKRRQNGARARSQDSEEALKTLEIDGYKTVFVKKIALLPVALTDSKPQGQSNHG